MWLNNFIHMIYFTSKLMWKIPSFILTGRTGVPWCRHRGKEGVIVIPGIQKTTHSLLAKMVIFSSCSPLKCCFTLTCCLPCRSASSCAVCTYIISWVPSKTTSHKYQVRRSSDFFQILLVGNPTSLEFCSNSVTHSFQLTFVTTKQKGPSK